ncbi:MAG: hypothetical protein HRT45_13365 [Bdellovibrionales bacterium]|nr:hypothetical protein [Bdellovibrionales bacterium]
MKLMRIILLLFLHTPLTASSKTTADKVSFEFWEQRLHSTQTHYQASDWDSFFAETLFFRLHLSRLDLTENLTGLADTFLALEIVALSKHCRWSVIKRLKKQYLAEEKTVERYPKAHKALSFVEAKQDLTLPEIDQENINLKWYEVLQQKRDQWPVAIKTLANLESPKGVKLKVKSLCDQKPE